MHTLKTMGEIFIQKIYHKAKSINNVLESAWVTFIHIIVYSFIRTVLQRDL